MSVLLSTARIRDVAIIDDNDDTRETMSDYLKGADFVPHLLTGPFRTIDDLVSAVMRVSNAVVCDHRLTTRNFAPCSGAEVVDLCYRKSFPPVLITTWSKADIDQIRRYRRRIPVLLTPEEANPDTITRGFEACMAEFRDVFQSTRRPWRTLVRVEDVDFDQKPPVVYAVVPGWNSEEVIRFPLDMIPDDLYPFVKSGERFYAKVNIGAESQEDLYFDEFEYRGR